MSDHAESQAKTPADVGEVAPQVDPTSLDNQPATQVGAQPATNPEALTSTEPVTNPEPTPVEAGTDAESPQVALRPAALTEPAAVTEPIPATEAAAIAERTATEDTATEGVEAAVTLTTEPAAVTEPIPAAPPVAEPTPAAPAPERAATPAPEPAPAPNAEPTPAPAPAPAPQPAPSPSPRPAPTPRPAPRPGPKPGGPKPGAPKPSAIAQPKPAAAPEPVPAPALDEAAAAAAAEFGRVDDEGTVFVRDAETERAVGQFPGVPAAEAITLYVRRYLDLDAKVTLFEARLTATDLSVKEIDQTIAKLTEETAEPSAVGDLEALRTRVTGLKEVAKERRAVLEAERAAAKEAALAARTEIIEAAEKIADTDPSKMQWRPAGEQLRTLLDQWKEAQHNGPRIDRAAEEALWKRFSKARTSFDRERRHYFAELETRNASAKLAKEKLVERAQALSTSTDWGATASAYRDLMAEWKSAGRASRKDDDALWAQFRAAQDAFFQARDAMNAATDAEYAANLAVKEQLLTEAEALLPITDINAAKQAIRSIQDRWEAAGRVPRGDIQRVEGRLRAVESAVRDFEQAKWSRTNPETRARAEGAASQLESAIASLEKDLAKAQAAGDTRKVADVEAALAARRSWLEQVMRAAQDSRG